MTEAGTIPSPAERSAAGRLARLHLRTGALSLARAELETLAGCDGLDDESLVDLAEVRWRTGDLDGAGEAARAYLETGGDDLGALVIAAEAAVLGNHVGEAQRLVERALAHGGAAVDEVFAGMPRSGIWPLDPLARPEQGPLFATPGEAARPALPAAAPALLAPQPPHPQAAAAPIVGPGLWDDQLPPAAPLPEARAAFEAGRAALASGDLAAAAVRFGLTLRLAPELASAVLAVLPAGADPALDLVRGDALRLGGQEAAARRAWAEAAATVDDVWPQRPAPEDGAQETKENS